MKKVITVVRKICLSDSEKSPYRVTVKSSYHPHRKGTYAGLMMSGKLNSYLIEIDRIAKERIEIITAKLLESNPAPDKTIDPMGWTGHMNNLRRSAEESVLTELVYS